MYDNNYFEDTLDDFIKWCIKLKISGDSTTYQKVEKIMQILMKKRHSDLSSKDFSDLVNFIIDIQLAHNKEWALKKENQEKIKKIKKGLE